MIEIRHLKKEYQFSTPLKDVNAVINDGDVISIIGPEGTGKSTLLRCINMLETPTSGDILIDGESITKKGCKVHLLRRKMGMVFQSSNLFDHLNIVENIMIGPREVLKLSRQDAYDRAMELLRTVGLADKALFFPDELTGGQKQRAAIARTLAMNPEIILFEEPTSSLDPTKAGEVLSVIKDLAKKGLTMLIVTHEMNFARELSNRIFYLDQGIIYEEGPPEKIFEHPEKPRTRHFIRRLKVLEENITGKDFDFIGINSDIEEFGLKHQIREGGIASMQLVFKEICVSLVLPSLKDDESLYTAFELSDAENSIEFYICYGMDKVFNPLSNMDESSKKRLESASRSLSYKALESGEYKNEIKVELKLS